MRTEKDYDIEDLLPPGYWANAVSPFSALLTVSLAMPALQLFVHQTFRAVLVYTISKGSLQTDFHSKQTSYIKPDLARHSVV